LRFAAAGLRHPQWLPHSGDVRELRSMLKSAMLLAAANALKLDVNVRTLRQLSAPAG
jgi:hypothetical protein